MSHFDTIKSLITPVKETKVFPKFLHWLLTDPKYGSINQTKDKKSIEAIQGVIDLYEEWLNTDVKPEQGRWLKAKEVVWTATNTYTAAYTADTAAAANAVYAANAAAAAANAAAGIPRSEVEKAQLDKLNELINDYNKVSSKDETPNQVVEFLTNSLKSFGYSVIKTEELNRLKKLEEGILALTE